MVPKHIIPVKMRDEYIYHHISYKLKDPQSKVKNATCRPGLDAPVQCCKRPAYYLAFPVEGYVGTFFQ